MPRQSKGPHLWYRKERRDPRTCKLKESGAWLILDAGKQIPTGCPKVEIGEAQIKLANYVAERYRPPRREQDIEELVVADVLSIYDEDAGSQQANQRVYVGTLGRLNDFWGARKLAEITGETCRAYVKERKTPGGARRDLVVST